LQQLVLNHLLWLLRIIFFIQPLLGTYSEHLDCFLNRSRSLAGAENTPAIDNFFRRLLRKLPPLIAKI